MAHYATRAQFEAYFVDWTTTDPVALEDLLEKASADVDALLGAWPLQDDGSKLGPVTTTNPLELTPAQRARLSQATVIQARYRHEQGPEFFRHGQYASVTGPEFSTTGELPRISPEVRARIVDAGLMNPRRRGIRATA